jgi:hypothetical protein
MLHFSNIFTNQVMFIKLKILIRFSALPPVEFLVSNLISGLASGPLSCLPQTSPKAWSNSSWKFNMQIRTFMFLKLPTKYTTNYSKKYPFF